MINYSVILGLLIPAATIAGLMLVVHRETILHPLAIVSSLVSFVTASVIAYFVFAGKSYAIVIDQIWISAIGAKIKLGIEPISAAMIWITAFSTLLAVAASFRDLREKRESSISIAFHYLLIFLIQLALMGFFMARDLLLLFVCYETVLIPMYLLILVWGGKERVYASVKFLIFTLFGSLPLLLSIAAVSIVAWQVNGELIFDIDRLIQMNFSENASRWLFAGFALAFLVKVPLWPLHTWLPDAHTEAPTAGSILLAGVLLKMGGYGLLAVVIPMFPSAAIDAAPIMITFALCGILLGALASLAQKDAKRLIAYSSVSHMAFVVLGLFSFTAEAWSGAVFQMVAHAISTGGLFYFVGALYRRRHDRMLESFGGLATLAPGLCSFAGVLIFSSLAFPGTAGFAAEFMVLYGAFIYQPVVAILAAPVVILSASYMLKFFKAIAFGTPTAEFAESWNGAHKEEIAVVAFCALLLVAIGVAPWQSLMKNIEPSVISILSAVSR
ncbi:MAG: hypothetical protein AUJ18_03430 [Candidatus Hydrogenedentes bacterium CG1_02_42_14]|nr:MAG: hypothetical protein AUJ18_03430 [Candidatus Hydrogenedentes bacterium CG1_02_42_14]